MSHIYLGSRRNTGSAGGDQSDSRFDQIRTLSQDGVQERNGGGMPLISSINRSNSLVDISHLSKNTKKRRKNKECEQCDYLNELIDQLE